MTEAVHIPNSTPFDLIAEDAQSWIDEARHWADGKPVETQEQADDVARIIDALRQTAKAADEARKVENKPHDDAKAAVQAKYAPLFADPKTKTPGKVFTAIDALNAAKRPFLLALEAEQEAIRQKAREEAEKAAQAAAEAARQANAASLEEREKAEALARAAEQAQALARQADKAKAHAHGGGRAQGLRTRVVAEITDLKAAVSFYWLENPEPFRALAQKLADDDARQNRRVANGVTFREERV